MDLGFLKGNRLVILGIGNRIKGDDAVGSLVAEGLQGNENVLVVDCEDVPENFKSRILEFEPDAILMVDAVDFKGGAGDIHVFELGGESPATRTTHKISLKALAYSLKQETMAEIYLIGVQPKSIEFGDEMCAEVEGARKKVLDYLTTNLLSR